ncbi:MAG: hypothetical protein WDN00_14875 [Limisphaerales bacterium]
MISPDQNTLSTPMLAGRTAFFLQPFALTVSDVFPPPVFFKVGVGTTEEKRRPFADHERLVAQCAQLRGDAALHHAHGRHHDDDGKHADQHAQQRQ